MATALDVIFSAIVILAWVGLLCLLCILDEPDGDDEIDWYYHHHW